MSFKEYINEILEEEEINESYPDELSQYVGKEFDLSDDLPDEFKNRNIMEKGYAAGAKALEWTFMGKKYKTYRLNAKMRVRNDNILIDFGTSYSGTSDGYALSTIMVNFTLVLKFNKKGICTGVERQAIAGRVRGGHSDFQNVSDAKGMTLAEIKSAVSKSSKKTF